MAFENNGQIRLEFNFYPIAESLNKTKTAILKEKYVFFHFSIENYLPAVLEVNSYSITKGLHRQIMLMESEKKTFEKL